MLYLDGIPYLLYLMQNYLGLTYLKSYMRLAMTLLASTSHVHMLVKVSFSFMIDFCPTLTNYVFQVVQFESY